uniref:Uncharacterized protein n=1 Tax=Oryza meridionalis TaxID=40149 RepID=A0A0E0EI56_9ORYZ
MSEGKLETRARQRQGGVGTMVVECEMCGKAATVVGEGKPPRLQLDPGLHMPLKLTEAALYTLADSTIVAADVVDGGGGPEQSMEAAHAQKIRGRFGFISEALGVMLKMFGKWSGESEFGVMWVPG